MIPWGSMPVYPITSESIKRDIIYYRETVSYSRVVNSQNNSRSGQFYCVVDRLLCCGFTFIPTIISGGDPRSGFIESKGNCGRSQKL